MKTFAMTAALAATTATAAFAGGIDRSGQDISVLFKDGNYAQLTFGNVAPTIPGSIATPLGSISISQSAVDFSSFSLAYKQQLSDNLSFAIIWDQPYGADIQYVDAPIAPGKAFVDSQALTAALRYEMNNGFSVHGGLRAQKIKGEIISTPGLLNATSGTDFGGLVGVAYEKPEIALRVSLTYFTGIDHEFDGLHVNPLTGASAPTTVSVSLPEAFNLDFQTGIAENTLLFGSIRHAKWQGVSLDSNTGAGQVNWVNFKEDTTAYKIGLGRKLNDNWSVAVSYGWEAGADTGTSFLAPAGASQSLGAGATYTQDNFEISAGVQYTKFDTKTVAPVVFDGGDAIAVGLKLGFKF